MPDRYRSIIDVHVILERGGEILLLERRGTGYCDGQLHLPSGHLEEGEPLPEGAARELREEVGVNVDPPTSAWLPSSTTASAPDHRWMANHTLADRPSANTGPSGP